MSDCEANREELLEHLGRDYLRKEEALGLMWEHLGMDLGIDWTLAARAAHTSIAWRSAKGDRGSRDSLES
jgi:hypothetical protein